MPSAKTETTNTFLPAVVSDEFIAALDLAASNKSLNAASQFKRAFATAGAVAQLKALLTPEIMKPILNLQNSALGFMTDKRDSGYSLGTVTECLIDAVLSGVSPVGNEFNIISGRTYITKNGMKHKLRDIDGLTFSTTPGIPKMMGDKGAVIDMTIDWTFNGKKESKTLTIAVRVNAGMGADAIIGKATRKAYAWLYENVTGQTVDEGEANEIAPIIESKVSTIETTPAEAPKTENAEAELPM